MYESSIVQHFVEQGIKQGIEQGIEQGREQGREQGIEQGSREYILDVLELRFPAAEVRRLADRLEAINDVQRLKQLFRAAIQAPSLEAFRTLLDADE